MGASLGGRFLCRLVAASTSPVAANWPRPPPPGGRRRPAAPSSRCHRRKQRPPPVPQLRRGGPVPGPMMGNLSRSVRYAVRGCWISSGHGLSRSAGCLAVGLQELPLLSLFCLTSSRRSARSLVDGGPLYYNDRCNTSWEMEVCYEKTFDLSACFGSAGARAAGAIGSRLPAVLGL